MKIKRNTIKWRIFKYNLVVIILLVALTTIIFNTVVHMYIKKDIIEQLDRIASHAEDTALRKGPDFFPKDETVPPPPHPPEAKYNDLQTDNELFRFYFMLDRSLRETLSVLNANYILLDNQKNIINPLPEEFMDVSSEFTKIITDEIDKSKNSNSETCLNFHLSGTEYIAIIKPVSQKNTFGLGWLIIYSSLQKVNQLKWGINLILLAILILSALIITLVSSLVAKKISKPFSSLNQHIRAISERKFGTKIHIPVDDELQELVNNINIMSEKLENYDKAQKTFLQNASHEFRTPLMSIQSYAEGIKYNVIQSDTAADIIIDETRRMTHLVEDLLYLSRLNTIEESYNFSSLNSEDLINSCIERMSGIAEKNNVKLSFLNDGKNVWIDADEEKLSRAIMNVLSNCIRYAASKVDVTLKVAANTMKLAISDDGPGFDKDELPNIFERFYKGRKGNLGLGLAISNNIIEKHNGTITAGNSKSGAIFIIKLPIAKRFTS